MLATKATETGSEDVLGNKHAHAVPERPNDESVLQHRPTLPTGLQRKPNVELDTRTTRHLRHAMPPVHDIQHALDVRLGVQTGVQRRV